MIGDHIALIVIDMQRDFIDPGAPIECVGGRAIIPNIQMLLAVARKNHVRIIYTQEAHRPEKVDFGLELMRGEPEHCIEGTSGIDIVPELAMNTGDFLVRKRRYSGFFATDLDILLRGLGVRVLILVGVATDICVRATAQDAQQHGYEVMIPKECVAGTTMSRHEAALENIHHVFGKVISMDQALNILETVE